MQEPSDVVACHVLHVLALGYEQYRSVAPRTSMARSLKLHPCKCRTGVPRKCGKGALDAKHKGAAAIAFYSSHNGLPAAPSCRIGLVLLEAVERS